jgi:integrase
MRRTCTAAQEPPRAAVIPLSFRARAICKWKLLATAIRFAEQFARERKEVALLTWRYLLIPEGKKDNATRFVPMSDRMKTMLLAWCGSRKEGWVFPSSRSKSGHLTTIAKGFQAAQGRAGLDKKLVPYSATHTYGTYTMEKSGNAFAVSKSMGHADLKSMEPYQHQDLEPLRIAINQRNQRKKLGQVLENAS